MVRRGHVKCQQAGLRQMYMGTYQVMGGLINWQQILFGFCFEFASGNVKIMVTRQMCAMFLYSMMREAPKW